MIEESALITAEIKADEVIVQGRVKGGTMLKAESSLLRTAISREKYRHLPLWS